MVKRTLLAIGTILVVVAFVVTLVGTSQNTAAASSTNKPDGIWYPVTECVQGSQVEQVYLWTPVILLNSPYGGSATGSSSQTVYGGFSVSSGGLSYSSSTSTLTADKVSASNGQSVGDFQLDQWTVYNAVDKTVLVTSGYGDPCTQPYVAKITQTTGDYSSGTLLPAGSQNDNNVATSYTAQAYLNGYWAYYNSVKFNIDYTNSPSGSISTNGAGATYSVAQQYVTKYSFSISAGLSTPVTGTGSVQETATVSWWFWTSYGTSYTYTFPSWYAEWYYQDLGAGNSGGWAFSYVG